MYNSDSLVRSYWALLGPQEPQFWEINQTLSSSLTITIMLHGNNDVNNPLDLIIVEYVLCVESF